MTIDDLDTPALLIDLDRVEANLHKWQTFCDQHGIDNVPHVKTHKIPELARWQMAGGAKGVTCQKLGEAEAMADGGIDEIFLTYNIVGAHKLARLTRLHGRVNLRVVADSEEVALGLNEVGCRTGRPLRVMVECDTGMHRVGVASPEAAARLAGQIQTMQGLEFSGFCTYPASEKSQEFFSRALALCRDQGIPVASVSGGGTPRMWTLGGNSCLTEYRAGTYIYNDRITVSQGVAQWSDCALSVLTAVVSTSGEHWVTVDGGTKTFSSDQYGQVGYGSQLEDPQTVLVRCSEEHGVLQHKEGKPRLSLGEKIRLIPNHACVVSNLHDVAYGVRGNEVVAQWEITARGKLQ